jgi:hypothetical protein
MAKKRPSLKLDENQRAYALTMAAIGEGPKPKPPGTREKNPEAVARGRKGGQKGGKARAANTSPRKLSKIGRAGALKRWQKPPEGSQ